jgi:hypothetical protein
MIHAENFPQNELQLAPVVLSRVGTQAAEPMADLKLVAREHTADPGELTLSIPQVLLGFGVATASLSVFIWALVKLWLFER